VLTKIESFKIFETFKGSQETTAFEDQLTLVVFQYGGWLEKLAVELK